MIVSLLNCLLFILQNFSYTSLIFGLLSLYAFFFFNLVLKLYHDHCFAENIVLPDRLSLMTMMALRKVALRPPPHTPMKLMSVTMTKHLTVWKKELFFLREYEPMKSFAFISNHIHEFVLWNVYLISFHRQWSCSVIVS